MRALDSGGVQGPGASTGRPHGSPGLVAPDSAEWPERQAAKPGEPRLPRKRESGQTVASEGGEEGAAALPPRLPKRQRVRMRARKSKQQQEKEQQEQKQEQLQQQQQQQQQQEGDIQLLQSPPAAGAGGPAPHRRESAKERRQRAKAAKARRQAEQQAATTARAQAKKAKKGKKKSKAGLEHEGDELTKYWAQVWGEKKGRCSVLMASLMYSQICSATAYLVVSTKESCLTGNRGSA